MRIRHRYLSLLLILGGAGTAAPLTAQDACPKPAFILPAKSLNIFSEQQENDLGDAIAEHVQRNYRIIDDEVTDNLRGIGRHLLAQLPPTNIRFQFYIVEVPEVNAMSFPGGRIYITRKLIAASRSEDELAGVVAHEIGHIITRQSAVDYTRIFQKVLGIKSVGGREDIFTKYNQLLDNVARNSKKLSEILRDSEEEEQIIADRVAVYLTKRAGYSPDAYVLLWNRISEVGGKTGSALSDFFGITKPEQKRLREMQRLANQLPEACAGTRTEKTLKQFEEWKTAVLEYSGLGRRESLTAVEWKRPLHPHFRGDISQMRFSSDGKYLLAQDTSSIFVLSREPFKVLFRIDAQDAYPAQFTPDCQSIVFSTQQMRVEKWSIPEESRTDLQEMTTAVNCIQTKLSPDAKHLACIDDQFSLIIFDTHTGNRLFQKKEFALLVSYRIYTLALARLFDELLGIHKSPNLAEMEFSPDGRYLVASAGIGGFLAYDFTTAAIFSLPKSIQNLLFYSFAFMDAGRLVGKSGSLGQKSAVVKFPSGEVQYEMQVGLASVSPVAHGDYIVLRPIENFPAGVMDLAQKKVFLASKQEAIDFYDKFFASERIDGVLFLFQIDKEAAVGEVALPQSPLPRLRTVALSEDMNWLAISESSRGAIWDLRKGERVFVSGDFNGAYFTADNMLLADFPKSKKEERLIASINPATAGVNIVTHLKDRKIQQEGLYLVERKEPDSSKNRKKSEPTLVVSSAETGKELWSQAYPKGWPDVEFNTKDDKAILIWPAWSDFVKEESKKDPELKKKIESRKERRGDYYIHILQASTGKLIGKIYVETGMGSFRIRAAEATGDYLTLYDSQNRLLIYSISNSKRLGQIFGANGDISPARQLLAAENERGILSFYSLPSMEKRGQLVFPSPLSYLEFSLDGKRLFVLTANQLTYLFNTNEMFSQKSSGAN